jgi:hypothetical protein
VLQLLNLENANPEVHKIIFFTIAIFAASSGLLLWGMCIWDCLGNKQIKSQNLVFAALIVFSWVGSIFYYFKFIYKRSERQELRQ